MTIIEIVTAGIIGLAVGVYLGFIWMAKAIGKQIKTTGELKISEGKALKVVRR